MSRRPAPIAPTFGCHAWNKDLGQVALSPNNSQVWLFNTNDNPAEMKAWGKPEHILTEHGGYVSAIDWHPETNYIVTCGHDRNAYVWVLEGQTWKPTLVILRINRAATSVKWSPNGAKFAVTSGAKCVPVCHFEEDSNWWISKMIKKHKSTVLTCAWSPNNLFLVTGATDFKCRIFSAYIDSETIGDPALLNDTGSIYKWKKAESFGTVLAEFDQAKAWVQGVSWSPNGTQIAFTGHGSSTHFVSLDLDDPKKSDVHTLWSKSLPHLTCDFLTDTQAVCAGFDMDPHLYTFVDGEWTFTRKLDPREEFSKKVVKSEAAAARNKFKNMDKRGQKNKSSASKIKTKHENTIIDVKVITETSFSTCAVDGRIIIWDLNKIL